MKYKAKGKSVDFLTTDNLLHVLLKNRGVNDPHSLLNLKADSVIDGMKMINMNRALKCLDYWLEVAEKELVRIHVIVDEDVDGYTSAASVINYLKDIKNDKGLQIEINYTVHDKKIHGIILSELEDVGFDLLIVPDAGSNDVDECLALHKRNPDGDIIILDHHDITSDNEYAIVVNCKDGEYPNPTLSGAGVVYKFLKEYDKLKGYDYADGYLDLFALGNIGDIMDLRNGETRYLTLQGLEKFTDRNLFLKEIVEKQEFTMKGEASITKVGWNVSPLINAVTRVGTHEERINTFRALLGDEEVVKYKPRKSKNNPNPVEMEITLQKDMARQCGNIKARQDKISKKGMEVLDEIIMEQGLDKYKLLVVDATGLIEKDFTGLIANKLKSKYRRPVLVLKSMNDDTYGGSGRNYELFPLDNLNEFLNELDVFDYVAGHDNSFGFNIKKDKVDLLISRSEEALKDVALEDVYHVDYEIPVGRLKPQSVLQVGRWANLWGNKLDEPLFAVTDVYINIDDIKLLGEKKNIIKIESRDLQFIKKYANEDVYNRMIMRSGKGLTKKKSNRLKFDFVCKFTLNEYEGKEYPQIEIVDFNVSQGSEVRF